MIYNRHTSLETFKDIAFENRQYSYPDDRQFSGWKWVHVTVLRENHLSSAIRLQMLAIQHLEEILDPLLLAKGTIQNHTQIHNNLVKMKNRYKRLSMLGDEYAKRRGYTSLESIPYFRKWFDGYTKLDGVYPYLHYLGSGKVVVPAREV